MFKSSRVPETFIMISALRAIYETDPFPPGRRGFTNLLSKFILDFRLAKRDKIRGMD
jgi:hypothetical protein